MGQARKTVKHRIRRASPLLKLDFGLRITILFVVFLTIDVAAFTCQFAVQACALAGTHIAV